jgi:hypothetical protein
MIVGLGRYRVDGGPETLLHKPEPDFGAADRTSLRIADGDNEWLRQLGADLCFLGIARDDPQDRSRTVIGQGEVPAAAAEPPCDRYEGKRDKPFRAHRASSRPEGPIHPNHLLDPTVESDPPESIQVTGPALPPGQVAGHKRDEAKGEEGTTGFLHSSPFTRATYDL